MVRGWPVKPFGKRVYIGSREWEVHCSFFFFFFFFFDKTGGIADSFNWRQNGLRVLFVEVRELRRQIFSFDSDFLITI